MITLATVDVVLRGAGIAEGLQEVGGPNAGAAVERILKSVGLPKGQPWCAAWVYDVGHQMLGVDWTLPRTGSCDVLLVHARKRNILHDTPKAGDVFLVMKTYTDAIHTGFVTKVNADGTVATIEGNTNPAGGRDGYGVFKRTRKAVGMKYIRWAA